MNQTANSASQSEPKSNQAPSQRRLFAELIICILLPTLILKKLSGEDSLGVTYSLLLALSLPLGFAIYHFLQERKLGLVPALGFISILLTGVIGLLELGPEYLAIKEAMIPGIIGLATLISLKTPYPLVKTFLYNDMIMQTDKIDAALQKNNYQNAFEQTLKNATYLLAASFLVSAVLNYVLAKIIVTAQAGTEAFNDQLATMTLLSYPVIVIPSMVIMIVAMIYLFKKIKQLTGYSFEAVLNQPTVEDKTKST